MSTSQINQTLKKLLENLPTDWLRLTTHRLDIYNEKLAKVEFLERFAGLDPSDKKSLEDLPTAFDYIRLGHPLSCVLEWALAKGAGLDPKSVISFSSQSMPLLAILRRNHFLNKKSRLVYKYEEHLPKGFDTGLLISVYRYDFQLVQTSHFDDLPSFEGSTIVIGPSDVETPKEADFVLRLYPHHGSIVEVIDDRDGYVDEIQHVRRRESIAMTPHSSLEVLQEMVGQVVEPLRKGDDKKLQETIKSITQGSGEAVLGSCGLSVQYAIMMGLVHYANENYPHHEIKFIVPPNCYGGTNDQARRVAACIDNVEIIDLPVDSGKDMVSELERILEEVALDNGVPYIIAEIPTNPRVEIPDLEKLRATLKKTRKDGNGGEAVAPVFILDQTFCPNVLFFGEKGYLRDAQVISYVSGSKFPSGGLVTAGYAMANDSAHRYMAYVQKHLELCDNKATPYQIKVLTEEMPTMNDRILAAYKNTQGFVDYIQETLPAAKINFVSHELAEATFTPSVFSLDLPTKGESHEEREAYKRELNHKLIEMMIAAVSDESKHCVSYGQLKGCYWTIPATSTQGTTKETDKDYIVRVSVAADFSLEKHKAVFKEFVQTYYSEGNS
jgi:cystathionine beta-lyase/cystathionine gamma-synthase